jgi:hypothetical protein
MARPVLAARAWLSWKETCVAPSMTDCEKSLARTGIPSMNLLAKKDKASPPRLVQIQIVPAIVGNRLSGMANQPAL